LFAAWSSGVDGDRAKQLQVSEFMTPCQTWFAELTPAETYS
jgi:hypothetical protein